jgi:pimeloyl-ACP methyl ester carboxylesterase
VGRVLRGIGVILTSALIGVVALQCPASAASGASTAAGPGEALNPPIEAKYLATGPDTVRTQTVNDSAGKAIYQLYYPADLAGARHPIVTWGNGTGAVPGVYDGLLRHLASWGYAVVATTDTTTGTGTTILNGARYLVERDDDPASVFHDRLDTHQIAAVGHSQGASGVINAATRSDGLITTVVPLGLPARWVQEKAQLPIDVTKLRVPILYLGGSLDVITPPAGILDYYNETSQPSGYAILRLADHFTEMGNGGRFRGYLTAWLDYQLRGDPHGASAFVGPSPEINTNLFWQDQREKHLSSPSDD